MLRAPQVIDSSFWRWGFWKGRAKWGAELAIECLWHHNQTVRGTGEENESALGHPGRAPLLGSGGLGSTKASVPSSWAREEQLLES